VFCSLAYNTFDSGLSSYDKLLRKHLPETVKLNQDSLYDNLINICLFISKLSDTNAKYCIKSSEALYCRCISSNNLVLIDILRYLEHIKPQKHLLMRNNILGGMVIFFVVLACLLMHDDISSQKNKKTEVITSQVDDQKEQTDLAVVEEED
jgi:hypothetical protein